MATGGVPGFIGGGIAVLVGGAMDIIGVGTIYIGYKMIEPDDCE